MTIDLKELSGWLLGPLGTLVLCLVLLWAGHKRMWVFGWYADELRKRNERLENRIDKLAGENKQVTSLAEKTATIAEKKLEVTSE